MALLHELHLVVLHLILVRRTLESMVGWMRASKMFLGLIIVLENFLAVFPTLVVLHLSSHSMS